MRKALLIIAVIVLLTAAALLAIRSFLIIRPPLVSEIDTCTLQTRHAGDSMVYCGDSWLHTSKTGLYELYTEGNPYYRGLVTGKLIRRLLYKQEKTFVDQIHKYVPSDSYLNFLKFLVAVFNRNIDENIKAEYLQEIYGLSKFASNDFDNIGSKYQRLLNYQAAHDIGHMMQNYHLVGCTSFAVWNEKSADSSLLVGRNFDFYVSDEFAEDKIVSFVKPDSGYRYMMITWGGMMGVVSGMNDQGLTVTINAAKSKVPLHAACPVSFVAKHILQYAQNIDEALNIARKYEVFVSETFLIGSAQDNKACIIEKNTEKTTLFRPYSSFVIATNHFQSPEFASDKLNIAQQKESPTSIRYKRTEQLIKEAGRIDAAKAAAILRNPYGRDDKVIGFTNEEAVNQYIAHHSVIFEPEKLRVWVSTSPYQLGAYVCYDLTKIFAKKECFKQEGELYDFELSLLPDSVLLTEYYTKVVQYKKTRDVVNDYLKGNQKNIDETIIAQLIILNPEFYQSYYLAGEYYYKNKEYKKALTNFETAVGKEIPYLSDRKKISGRIDECRKKVKN